MYTPEKPSFKSTSWFPDDVLNIDNIHFEQIVDWIYSAELQLNKANSSVFFIWIHPYWYSFH